jgi:hypothetical protein
MVRTVILKQSAATPGSRYRRIRPCARIHGTHGTTPAARIAADPFSHIFSLGLATFVITKDNWTVFASKITRGSVIITFNGLNYPK